VLLQQLILLLLSVILSGAAGWYAGGIKANSKQVTLERDLLDHTQAIARTDRHLAIVLRLVVDIARKQDLTIRATDLLALTDILGEDGQ